MIDIDLGAVQTRIHHTRGLSPRARGKHRFTIVPGLWVGPIPASAGETAPSPLPSFRRRAYPRERGGNKKLREQLVAKKGLSPRARGKLQRSFWQCALAGPIPASAGETRTSCAICSQQRAYPRERGGNWRNPMGDWTDAGLLSSDTKI